MSKPTIVIGQPWGGLGDNLQFSTLPQVYSEQGYDVYISNENAVRNQEIHDLIWGMNPYVKGILNSPPTAGKCKGFHIHTDNPMKNMELMHGLSNGTQKYPILYYKPKLISDLSNCLLFDTTSIAQKYRNKRIISDEMTSASKYDRSMTHLHTGRETFFSHVFTSYFFRYFQFFVPIAQGGGPVPGPVSGPVSGPLQLKEVEEALEEANKE